MNDLLDRFERHKYGIIGTLTVHTMLLFVFTTLEMQPEVLPEERTDMEVELLSIDEAEQLLEQTENEEMAMANEKVQNLTSNIMAERTVQTYSPQRLAEAVEEEVREFERAEFERLQEERRERGEEVTIPELDPSKWNKELYMDRAAEPVKVEGAVTVWHTLEGRNRENDVPGYLCPSQGRVAVNVTVAANGVVQKADVDMSRSSQADACMIEHALRSTKRARFSSGSVQSGTVFFRFLPQ